MVTVKNILDNEDFRKLLIRAKKRISIKREGSGNSTAFQSSQELNELNIVISFPGSDENRIKIIEIPILTFAVFSKTMNLVQYRYGN